MKSMRVDPNERSRVLVALMLIFLAACTTEQLTAPEYVKWVENEKNGLMISKQIGEMEFQLQYRPLEYVVMMDTKNMNLAADALESRKKEMSGLQHFVFRMRVAGFEDDILKYKLNQPGEYEERVKYLSFNVQNDFRLIDGADTLPCTICTYERAFGVTPYTTMVLGFPESSGGLSHKTLIYQDQLLGAGPVMMTIEKESIENIPQLKLVH